ncbi:MAG: hypothetical protein IIV04_05235 [Bacteroidaceae bacterium]|nr:hypothetical protein [Bacteroidaceae bacterium]
MKKTLFIAALMSMFFGSVAAQEKFSFKFYGFVRNYACYDTRESLTSNSEQFYYMPKNEKLDADGNDLNAQPNMMLLSITTRLGLNITGPEFLGAKTSAKIEADFAGFGTNNTVLRIRQAYAKMDWEHNKLLVGQAWHPMMGDMMPDVFSLETGAPFTPFSRTPQLRYDYVNKGVTLTATALYQFQYTSYGPKDVAKDDYTSTGSFDYARNAVVPEIYLQAMYKNGGFQAGVGVDILTIKPRQSYNWDVTEYSPVLDGNDNPTFDANGNPITVGNQVTKTFKCKEAPVVSFTPTLFASYKADRWGIKGRVTYAQNAAHLSMISGYGVTNIKDNGEWEYGTINSIGGWIDATYKQPLKKGYLQFCCFAGYTKNLGCESNFVHNEKNEYIIYMRGEKNMDYMWRVAPSILYTHNALQIGVEYNPTTVGYGEKEKNYTMKNPRPVTNHRICAMVKYNF